jgi:hypothetical protein
MIVGLVRPDAGSILIDDKDITGLPMFRRARMGVGYLQQEPSVFRNLTVRENLDLVLQELEKTPAERERMVDHLVDALIDRGVRVRRFHATSTDLGDIAMALVDAATIVIAAPTVLFGPHPAVIEPAYLANALRPKARFATVLTSYGWGGRTVEILKGMLGQLKLEFLEPVVTKGFPSTEAQEAIGTLADTIRDRHAASTSDWAGLA